MEGDHERTTSRPCAEDTGRPGDGGVSLEDYVSLVKSMLPPLPGTPAEEPLDDMISRILDEHEVPKPSAEGPLDVDAMWDL